VSPKNILRHSESSGT